MINVSNFTKAYRQFVAVDNISFNVAAGSVTGLVGPNGAGKTTTMRSICGILRPTAGTLSVGTYDVAVDPVSAKKLLAYIPDDPPLFDALTIWEHIRFVASAYQIQAWQSVAEGLLHDYSLADKRDSLAGQLSRGMRQKVAVVCALLRQPAALMFDEPLTGLDPPGIRTLKKSIVAEAKRGAAVMVSSHLLGLVEDICTDLIIMQKGQVLFSGTVEQARLRYGGESGVLTLEELFFLATDSPPNAVPPPDLTFIQGDETGQSPTSRKP